MCAIVWLRTSRKIIREKEIFLSCKFMLNFINSDKKNRYWDATEFFFIQFMPRERWEFTLGLSVLRIRTITTDHHIISHSMCLLQFIFSNSPSKRRERKNVPFGDTASFRKFLYSHAVNCVLMLYFRNTNNNEKTKCEKKYNKYWWYCS